MLSKHPLKGEKIKTIIVFDTEFDKNTTNATKIKVRFGFNMVIISNSFTPGENDRIPVGIGIKKN